MSSFILAANAPDKLALARSRSARSASTLDRRLRFGRLLLCFSSVNRTLLGRLSKAGGPKSEQDGEYGDGSGESEFSDSANDAADGLRRIPTEGAGRSR